MSQFMKAVVEEVLKGKKPHTQQKREPSPSPSANGQWNDDDTLQQLVRPNYQNRNLEKRLAALNQKPGQEKKDHQREFNHTQQPLSRPDNPISQLKKVSMSQASPERAEVRTNSKPPIENAKLIGTTKDGTSIWFFPSVHPNLSSAFSRATTQVSVAVVTSKNCYPSQLLLLNEWLNHSPELKYHLVWSRTNLQPLSLELYHPDASRLENVVKALFLQLNKRAETKVETYHLLSPSAWISKQLGITKSTESVGILEGLSYFNNLLVLDRFYKSEPSHTNLAIQLEQNYLITTGKTETNREILATLKKLAEQI
ncbi:hypothetical protein [Pseudoneobacillus sp. C159]